MNEKINQLKQEFEEQKLRFDEMLAKAKERAVRSMLTKGCPCNVFPYEWELSGRGKLGGTEVKEIPRSTMSDSYFQTYFDEKDRVVLSEQWSFKKLRYFTIYLYEGNTIKSFLWMIPLPADNGYELQFLTLLELENDKAIQKHTYSPLAAHISIGTYAYEHDMLVEILMKFSALKYSYTLDYKKDKTLDRIVRAFSDGTLQQVYPKVRWIKSEGLVME